MARVLVVDDRPADGELTSILLAHSGHRPLAVASGHEALAAIAEERPDVVISDILMPGMDGYELVRRLRGDEVGRDLPVIFHSSAYDDGEVEALAVACGAVDFVPKPVDPRELIAAVDRALAAAPAPPPIEVDEFDRRHLRALNRKLYDKVEELHAVDLERRRLLAELVRAQEQERSRIAADIHDDSIQIVSAAALRLDLLSRRLESEEDRAAVAAVATTVEEAIRRLRHLLFELRPRTLDRDGLAAALEIYLRELAREQGIETRLERDHDPDLPVEIRIILYRAAQEALRNVVRHACAASVVVTMRRRDDGIELSVVDDGMGFDPEEAMRVRPGHLGLSSIVEGIGAFGGRVDVRSAPGQGATVAVWLPERAWDAGAGAGAGDVTAEREVAGA